MKNTIFALFFTVSVLLAGYGYVSINADTQNVQFGQKCGLDKNGELDKSNEFEKCNDLDVGIL